MTTTAPERPSADARPTETTAPHSAPRLAPILLGTLALLTAIAPFATDLYLPAFPQMTAALGASESAVQLSLTAFLVGAGAGQLVFGPLSDRLGRRMPLLVGVAVFLVSSIGVALAPSIPWLVAGRLVQGLAGAAGMVLARAIIADRAHGAEAARAMTLMMMVGGIAPIVAPFVGSVLAGSIGWRGLLWIVAGIGAIAALAVVRVVPETHDPAAASSARTPWRTEVASLLRSRTYTGITVAFAMGFGTMMAYISASPFLYQELMGLSTVAYGVAFAVNALALMIVSAVAAKLTEKVPAGRLAALGLIINAVGVALVAALAFTGAPALWIAPALLLTVAPLGLVFGTTTALALDAAAHAPGTGSGLLGMLQFVLAGAVAPLVSLGGEASAVPLAIVMLVCTVGANVALQLGLAGTRDDAPAESAH
ncbi:multidrug effflux MFS transporter [Demequina pelophila]|uniref:multidrug effflux MFS transporter n=1 Tax=Demequina pelophila TaxID=1638984 RepID=UPI0007812DC1|nr:multidrug effflux MFS transporter [Demequina pelophila]